jgi:hypothetical protein
MRKKTNRISQPTRGGSTVDLHTLASLMHVDRRHGTATTDNERTVPERCKIAFVAANSRSTGQRKLAAECMETQRELKLTPHRSDFSFESRWAVTADELIQFLNELDPTVIHFAGHADACGLILQDDRGQPAAISPRALAMILRVAAPRARLVVINACEGLEHAEAVRTEVDAVVAMAGPITDDGARMFAARLYGALGNRKSVANAVAQGVARLAAAGLADELVPRCLTREGIDADRLVLSGPGCS